MPPRTKSKDKAEMTVISIELIEVSGTFQPRKNTSVGHQELVKSVAKHGILEPLIVRPAKAAGKYELIGGERRFLAAKAVGLKEVPVSVKRLSDIEAREVAIVENLQRENLNPIEEAEALLSLMAIMTKVSEAEVVQLLNQAANAARRGKQLNQGQAAKVAIIDALLARVGRITRESFRTNRLPLLNMPEDVVEAVRDNGLDYTKGRLVAKIESKEERSSILKELIDQDMPLSQLKFRVASVPRLKSSRQNKAREKLMDVISDSSINWDFDVKKQKEIDIAVDRLTKLLRG